MKKILSIILSLLMISSAFTGLGITANASEISSDEVSVNVGGFIYEVNDYGEAVLQGYDGGDVDVIIPVVIGGYTVTEIASGAFAGNDDIASVEIPCTIREIGNGAFANCENLYGVRIDNSAEIRIIKQSTFENCGNLREVVLPDKLEVIEDRAFFACESLESIVIPETTIYIALDAFDCVYPDFAVYGYTGTYVQDYANEKGFRFVPVGGSEYDAMYDYEFYEDGIMISRYYGNEAYLEIPKEINGHKVVAIGDYAFASNNMIEEVVLPDTVITIGMNAFRDCYNLQYVRATDGNFSNLNVAKISDFAFSGCNSLRRVDIYKNIREIGNYAFENCYNLERFYIGEYIELIGEGAFFGCYNMEHVIVEGEPEIIGENIIVDRRLNFYILGKRDTYLHNYALEHNINFVGLGEDIDPETGFVYRVDYTDYTGAIITGYIGTDTEYVTELIIPETIAGYDVFAIADHAFEDNLMITSIVIPETVKEIGEGAFGDCDYLTNVTFPDGLETIGRYAFAACDSLKRIVIPKETVLEEEAFSNYPDLLMYGYSNSPAQAYAEEYGITFVCFDAPDFTYEINDYNEVIITGYTGTDTDVVIPETIDGYTVVEICDSAFWLCSSLTSIEIPDSVTLIGDSAFGHCTSLMSIEIPDSVTSIGDSAFYYCESLTSIGIPNLVTAIGEKTFYHCESLTSIEIPDSVTVIGEYAFYYCESLTSIEIPDSVTTIGGYAFYGCRDLTSIVIPASVTSIGYNAFKGANSAVIYGYINSSAHTYARANAVTFVALDPIEGDFTYELNGDGNAVITDHIGTDTDVIIPDTIDGYTVVGIGEYAFSYNQSLTSIEISDSVTSIGYRAFWNCHNLTSIEIPDSVTEIGSCAFSKCSSLTSIEIPNSVTSIGESVFSACSSLISIEIPNSVTIISKNTFTNCSGLTSIEIPNSVMSIGDSAFYGCKSLTSIEIPNSVTSIGEDAFGYCISLTLVKISDSVTSIGAYAFSKCSSLTSIEIPDSVTSIGESAFWECSSLTSVEIPDSVISIDDYAFSLCSNLTTIEISNSVTSIGDYVFQDCSSLTSVEIPASVTTIGNNAFKGVNSEFVMYGYTDSYAQTYAEKNSITFVALDFVKGDLSGDGVVDVNDVTDIQKLIISDEELTEEQISLADVDGDGIVCVRDATHIQKYLAGVVDTL